MTTQDLAARLAAPFDPDDVKLKPQLVKNNRCLAISYVDVRLVQDRLDQVLGVDGWQDEYQLQPDGSVVCQLRVRIGNDWVTKADVGSPSEQPDSGDRLKAAFSDALKRAAVKFGVGRYLYRLPGEWMDYDPVKKQIVRPTRPQPAQAAPPAKVETPQTTPPARTLPANGMELYQRLRAREKDLVRSRKCRQGDLINEVASAGVRAGYPQNITEWSGPAIQFAVEVVKQFEQAA